VKAKDYTESSGNVFADLKVPNPEEAQLKARLAVTITKVIKARRLTQLEAGKLMGLKQPKVCDILAGRLTGYSVERLMRFLTLLGQDVQVVVRPHGPRGRARLQFVAA
jgi:predicted XRE-type DNA-binding protein